MSKNQDYVTAVIFNANKDSVLMYKEEEKLWLPTGPGVEIDMMDEIVACQTGLLLNSDLPENHRVTGSGRPTPDGGYLYHELYVYHAPEDAQPDVNTTSWVSLQTELVEKYLESSSTFDRAVGVFLKHRLLENTNDIGAFQRTPDDNQGLGSQILLWTPALAGIAG